MKLLFALALLIAVATCDTCISSPQTLNQGDNCLGGVSCKRGLYCGLDAKCTPLLTVGAACDTTHSLAMCPLGTTCKGPTGAQRCIANANAGGACNNTQVSEVPYCGSGLSCSFFTNMCTGGRLGDSCGNVTDCSVHNCTGNICTATPDGGACVGSGLSTCLPTSYCSLNSFTCVPRVPAGGICSGTTLCAAGLLCLGTTAADQTICVANQTRLPGEYCGGYDEVCKDSRKCRNTYCAKQSPEDCGSCAPGQVCQCNGLQLAMGYGKCGNDPCYQKRFDYSNCIWFKCGLTSLSTNYLSYPGSCANINCKDLAESYFACSPAFQLAPNHIFTFFFFALVAFVSKKF